MAWHWQVVLRMAMCDGRAVSSDSICVCAELVVWADVMCTSREQADSIANTFQQIYLGVYNDVLFYEVWLPARIEAQLR